MNESSGEPANSGNMPLLRLLSSSIRKPSKINFDSKTSGKQIIPTDREHIVLEISKVLTIFKKCTCLR